MESIYHQTYQAIEASFARFCKTMSIPDFTSSDEAAVYENVGKIHDIHKSLSKFSLQLRELKRAISRKVYDQESIKDKVVVENPDIFSKLKTKDERDAAIRSIYRKELSFEEDFIELNSSIERLIQDINIAIAECQKSFDSYELVYNFSRLNSMGYLLSQANHKLVDYSKEK